MLRLSLIEGNSRPVVQRMRNSAKGSSRTCQTAHRSSQPAALNQLQLSYTAVFLKGVKCKILVHYNITYYVT